MAINSKFNFCTVNNFWFLNNFCLYEKHQTVRWTERYSPLTHVHIEKYVSLDPKNKSTKKGLESSETTLNIRPLSSTQYVTKPNRASRSGFTLIGLLLKPLNFVAQLSILA